MIDLRCGEARDVLAGMGERSVHACITSPPYFGLRSYNGGAQEIGTEQTPQAYVAALVDVFRSVWRVLRDDGLLWMVLGDSYATGATRQTGRNDEGPANLARRFAVYGTGRPKAASATNPRQVQRVDYGGVPSKSLLGIPWRVAFALQDDGWLLRQECIWAKSNPMPESVKDRCTRGHETVFMLAKGPRYYYDQDAIREPHARFWDAQANGTVGKNGYRAITPIGGGAQPGRPEPHASGRNKRTVWTLATSPLSSKKYGVDTEHYAAFPPELVRPMVRAGCPPDGVVLDCFMGSGTTGLVAVQEGRRFVGCDINADYVRLAEARIATAQPALPLSLACG